MREIDCRVLSELMKNPKQSDRKLAKKIGSSQPTVTRVRRRLENKGYIREHTTIPNFNKLGYEILAVTFVKLRKELTPEQVENAKKFSLTKAKRSPRSGPFEVIMAERGIGLGYNGMFISYHKDYASYTKFREWLGQFPFFEMAEIESFLVNLQDKTRYLPLTLSNLAREVLTHEEKAK